MHTANPGQTGVLPSLRSLDETLSGKVVLAVSASLFVAACAHASVPLPFTPVPLTLSDLAVLLVGLSLAPSTAFAALVLYLAEGASGLPVFNPTGPGGLAQLLGPTGGYLFAYPAAAAIAGFLRRTLSTRPSYLSSTVAAGTASALIMLSGVVWLAFFAHLSAPVAFKLGAAPFLPGQVIKVLASAGIFTALARLRRS